MCDPTVLETSAGRESKPSVVLITSAQVRKMRWGGGQGGDRGFGGGGGLGDGCGGDEAEESYVFNSVLWLYIFFFYEWVLL